MTTKFSLFLNFFDLCFDLCFRPIFVNFRYVLVLAYLYWFFMKSFYSQQIFFDKWLLHHYALLYKYRKKSVKRKQTKNPKDFLKFVLWLIVS